MQHVPVTVAIELAVPIPSPIRHRYPWRDMAVGDSFLAPHARKPGDIGVSAAQRSTGFRFATRRTSRGMRVWRVA